jgi:hypothetical protein
MNGNHRWKLARTSEQVQGKAHPATLFSFLFTGRKFTMKFSRVLKKRAG